MKTPAIFLLMVFFCLSTWAGSHAATQGKWMTYKGAYFDIRYPASFRVRGSQRTDGERYDSAFFTSPDKTVEFYVYSPIWNGEPRDIEINEATEAYVSRNTEDKNGIKIRRAMIRALDGSYTRSFEDRENTNTNNRTVFGIKYRDQSAYDKYRQTYLTFKKSIKQYAD
jgi:hypothetical protein